MSMTMERLDPLCERNAREKMRWRGVVVIWSWPSAELASFSGLRPSRRSSRAVLLFPRFSLHQALG
jgi:hypothetical protein